MVTQHRRIVSPPPRSEEFTGESSREIPRNHRETGRTQSTVPTTHPSVADRPPIIKQKRRPGRQPMPRRNYIATIELADGTQADCRVTARGYGDAEKKALRIVLVELKEESEVNSDL